MRCRHKYEPPHNRFPQRQGRADPPPFDLKIYKGAKAWKVPRTFVEFLLNHAVAKQFLGGHLIIDCLSDAVPSEWAKYTWVPDELVVATLARVSEIRRKGDGTWQVTRTTVMMVKCLQ